MNEQLNNNKDKYIFDQHQFISICEGPSVWGQHRDICDLRVTGSAPQSFRVQGDYLN